MLRRRQEILVDVEVTKGTAVVPATPLRTFDPTIRNTTPYIPRRPVMGSLGSLAGSRGEYTGTVSLRAELRNGAAAPSAIVDAGLAVLLQLAGLKLTTGVWAPASAYSDHKTGTIYGYIDGQLRKLSGCAANLTLSADAGQPVQVEAELSGVWVDPASAALATPTHSAILPPRAASATLSLHGVGSLVVPRWKLSLNNTIAVRKDMDAAAGVLCYAVVDRDCQLELDIEQELAATHDFWGIWKASTEAAWSCAIGTVAENILTLAAPKVEYRTIEEIDLGGIAGFRVTAGLNSNAGDDELTLTPS